MFKKKYKNELEFNLLSTHQNSDSDSDGENDTGENNHRENHNEENDNAENKLNNFLLSQQSFCSVVYIPDNNQESLEIYVNPYKYLFSQISFTTYNWFQNKTKLAYIYINKFHNKLWLLELDNLEQRYYLDLQSSSNYLKTPNYFECTLSKYHGLVTSNTENKIWTVDIVVQKPRKKQLSINYSYPTKKLISISSYSPEKISIIKNFFLLVTG